MKLKFLLISVLLFVAVNHLYSQTLQQIEKKLTSVYHVVNGWDFYSEKDTLVVINDHLENLIMRYSASNPGMIHHPFKKLGAKYKGFGVLTSEDSLFRIYTWHSAEGGTMHAYRNVYQYKIGDKVYTRKYKKQSTWDPEVHYYGLQQVRSADKVYYVVLGCNVLFSSLTAYSVRIFSLENGNLNEHVRLIKTKTGMQNWVSYEIDWSKNEQVDRNENFYAIYYSKSQQNIELPLITADGRLTRRKIIYHFTGDYFEKIK